MHVQKARNISLSDEATGENQLIVLHQSSTYNDVNYSSLMRQIAVHNKQLEMIPQQAHLIDTEDEDEDLEEEDEGCDTLDIAEQNYEEVFDENAVANKTVFRNNGALMATALTKCKTRRRSRHKKARQYAI